MTDITIVYKTYRNDLKWLKYSLLSLKKYISFEHKILIYCHDECHNELIELIKQIEVDCRTIPVHYDINGYTKQMIVKLECYKDIETHYAMIIDSDCVFKETVTLEDIFTDGKIIWRFSIKNEKNSHGPEWTVWKKSYEDQSKEIQDKHYMANGNPFIFTKTAMQRASNKFIEMHGKTYLEYCTERLNKLNVSATDPICPNFMKLATVFEEFEWYGFYSHKYAENEYVFMHADNCSARSIWNKHKQYWSHGGIEQHEAELQSFL